MAKNGFIYLNVYNAFTCGQIVMKIGSITGKTVDVICGKIFFCVHGC